MSTSRLISHSLRAALLTGTGAALIGVPFALELAAPALVAGVFAGSVAIALGVAGTEPGTRGSLPLSAQSAYDSGLAFLLILVAIGFALWGDAAAMALFAIAGVAALVMTAVTRYSAGTA